MHIQTTQNKLFLLLILSHFFYNAPKRIILDLAPKIIDAEEALIVYNV